MNTQYWHAQQTDGGCMIICTVNGVDWAAMVRNTDMLNHYDKQNLFWSAVRRVQRAATQ